MKKNKIMPFTATWMDAEIIMLSEESQKEKDKFSFPFILLDLNSAMWLTATILNRLRV